MDYMSIDLRNVHIASSFDDIEISNKLCICVGEIDVDDEDFSIRLDLDFSKKSEEHSLWVEFNEKNARMLVSVFSEILKQRENATT